MSTGVKPMDDLAPEDFEAHPVWEFALDLEAVCDLAMRPVNAPPVYSLINRVVGTRATLANGNPVWLGLANVFLDNPVRTAQSMVARFYVSGQWQLPSRQVSPKLYGAEALAQKLGLAVGAAFPIAYDISDCCVGDSAVVRRVVNRPPL